MNDKQLAQQLLKIAKELVALGPIMVEFDMATSNDGGVPIAMTSSDSFPKDEKRWLDVAKKMGADLVYTDYGKMHQYGWEVEDKEAAKKLSDELKKDKTIKKFGLKVRISKDLSHEDHREAFMWTGPKMTNMQVETQIIDDQLKASFIVRGIDWDGRAKELQRKMQRSIEKAFQGEVTGLNAWDSRGQIDFSINGFVDGRSDISKTERNLTKLFT